jgi:hypothetical protein
MPLLNEKAVRVLFANIEDILLTNTVGLFHGIADYQLLNGSLQVFLSALEERQKECRLYMDTIGDILRQHIPNMGIYLVSLFFRTTPLSHAADRNTVLMKGPLSSSCKLCGCRNQNLPLTSMYDPPLQPRFETDVFFSAFEKTLPSETSTFQVTFSFQVNSPDVVI